MVVGGGGEGGISGTCLLFMFHMNISQFISRDRLHAVNQS